MKLETKKVKMVWWKSIQYDEEKLLDLYMGLTLSVAINIIECTKNIKKESVLCLGKQDFGYSVADLLNSKKKYSHNVNLDQFKNLDNNQKLSQRLFFKTLGFKNIDTLDLDEYEGANIIFDLNKDKTPKNLLNKYDFIYDGGTLEHIFNIGNALKHLTRMNKDRGVVFHSNPCNGYIDHGFFQISPTLYFDYYLTNQYNILYAGIIEQSIGRKIFPIRQDLYRTLDVNFGVKFTPKGVLNFCAQKSNETDEITTPQQGYYNAMWNDGKQKKYDVEMHVPLTNFKGIQYLFRFWIRTPYYLIEILKSLKKKF